MKRERCSFCRHKLAALIVDYHWLLMPLQKPAVRNMSGLAFARQAQNALR